MIFYVPPHHRGGCAQGNSKEVSHAMRILNAGGNCLASASRSAVSELEITKNWRACRAADLSTFESQFILKYQKDRNYIYIQLHELIPICCLLSFCTDLHQLTFCWLTCNRLPSFFWGIRIEVFGCFLISQLFLATLGAFGQEPFKMPNPFVRRIALGT